MQLRQGKGAKQQAAALLVTCSRLILPASVAPLPLIKGKPETTRTASQEAAPANLGTSLPAQAVATFAESEACQGLSHQKDLWSHPASTGSVGLSTAGSCASQPPFDVRLQLDFWPLLQQMLVRAVAPAAAVPWGLNVLEPCLLCKRSGEPVSRLLGTISCTKSLLCCPNLTPGRALYGANSDSPAMQYGLYVSEKTELPRVSYRSEPGAVTQ